MPDMACLIRHNLLDTRYYEELLSESSLLKALARSIGDACPDCLFLLPDLYFLLYKKVLFLEQPLPETLHGLIIEQFSQQSGLQKLRTRTAGSRAETHVALWVLTQGLLERIRGASWLRESAELLDALHDSVQSFDSGSPEDLQPDSPDLSQDFWKDLLTPPALTALATLTEALKPGSSLAEMVETLEEMAEQAAPSAEAKTGATGPLSPGVLDKSQAAAEGSDDPLEAFLETAADETNKEQNAASNAPPSGSSEASAVSPDAQPQSPASGDHSGSPQKGADSLKKAADEARKRLGGMAPGTWRGRKDRFLMAPEAGPDARRILMTGSPDLSKKPVAAGIDADQTAATSAETSPLKAAVGIGQPDRTGTATLSPKEILLGKVRKKMQRLSAETLFDRAVSELDTLSTLLSHVGTTPQEMDTLPYDEAIHLYKRTLDPQMVRFFNKVGQKREIAKLAQHRKKSRRDLPIDKIRPDDDLDSIIDDELTDLAIGIDAFENSFIDRFLHKSLLTRARVTRTARHKGPIILCYDGSGSMEGEKILETKAHILAFIEVARRQKRRMITIQFASATEPLFIREIHPRAIHFPEILELMDTFLRGGTDFERPLKEALVYLETDRFRNGDILFITDGICDISEAFKRRFLASKADQKFRLYAVIIHGNTYQDYGDLSDIADEILEIRQRDMSDWNQGVSEKIFSI